MPLAAGKEQEAILVEIAEVAGPELTAEVVAAREVLGAVRVAQHHVGSAVDHLADRASLV